MAYEDIANEVVAICDQIEPVVQDLEPWLGRLYADACGIDSANSIKHAANGMMGADNPFERIRSCASSVVEGWSGWSAEMSDGLRMPEHVADLLEYSDYTYYAGHLERDLEEHTELDPEGYIHQYVTEILDAKDAILNVISTLIGRYGA